MKYMVFGFHRFLKVAVIGNVLLQSSGLMKTEAVTKKSVVMIWTHSHGHGLGLTNKIKLPPPLQSTQYILCPLLISCTCSILTYTTCYKQVPLNTDRLKACPH